MPPKQRARASSSTTPTPTTTTTSTSSTPTLTTPSTTSATAKKPRAPSIKPSHLLPTLTRLFPKATFTPAAVKALCQVWLAEASHAAGQLPEGATLEDAHGYFVGRFPEKGEVLARLREEALRGGVKRGGRGGDDEGRAEVKGLTKKRKLSKKDKGRLEELMEEQERLLEASKGGAKKFVMEQAE